MSESGQFIRKIENELIAVGDGITRQWPLLVAGKPVRNVRGKPTLYREDWQGRVELSSTPRTNLALHSGDMSQWTPGLGTVTANASTAPNGDMAMARLTADGGGKPNLHSGGSHIGDNVLSAVFVRRDQNQYLSIAGFGNGNATFDLQAGTYNITGSWAGAGIVLLDATYALVFAYGVASGSPAQFFNMSRTADGVGAPDSGSVLDLWGAMLLTDATTPGVYIPTTDSPVTVTDYTYTAPTATVLLPEPLPPGAKLYWSGELVFDADPSLLPSSAPHGVRVIESATTSMAGMDTPLRKLWNPYTCPLELLPWLAWALSIDSWKSYWPESVKRERVARAIAIQRHKGTAQSVRAVIQSFGGAVQLREWWQRTPPGDPHTFDLILTLADAQGEAATAQYVDDVIAEVKRTKPVRSHFTFTQGITARAKVGVASVARPVVYRRLNFEAPAA